MTVKQLRDKLAQFPARIEEMYIQTMRRIEAQSPELVDLAMRLLIWVIYSQRSMSIAELQNALSYNAEDEEFEADSMVLEDTLGDLCCGLVTQEEKTGHVRLIRESRHTYHNTLV